MTPDIFGLLLQDGMATGAIYALLSLALVMVFTVTRIVFVPQGEFVTWCALTIATIQQGRSPGIVWTILAAALLATGMEVVERIRTQQLAGLWMRAVPLLLIPAATAATLRFAVNAASPYWMQAAGSVALITATGPVLHRIVFQPLAEASSLVLLIAALALHFTLVGIGLYVFGAEGSRLPDIGIDLQWLQAISLSTQTVIVVAGSLLVMACCYAFFGFSVLGKALRATAVNRDGARLVGIAPQTSGELAFTLAAFIGGVSGVLIGPVTTLYYDSGFLLGLKGFVGAIMGGMAGYGLAALGSILVGLLEAFASYGASAYKEIIVFTLVVPLLIWRSLQDPHGHADT